MDTKGIFWNLRIRKRPWYIWLSRLLWIAWFVFWSEVAIGSLKEMEQRAFVIFSIIFMLSLLVGFVLWFRGYKEFKKNKP